jgi:predicted outer membrane protein
MKTLITLTILAVAGLFLASCGSQSSDPATTTTATESITVGFAQTGAESAWRTA